MRHHSLPSLSKETAIKPETALARSTTKIPIAYPEESIGDVRAALERNTKLYDSIRYVYVVDSAYVLLGVLSIKDLFRAPSSATISDIMTRNPFSVHPNVDQEHVAMRSVYHKIGAMPVITKEGVLLGAVTSHSLLSILHAEHTEDFLRIAGMHGKNDLEIGAAQASVGTHVSKRLPWLVVGLFGGMCAVFIVSSFERVLAEEITLAAFIPAIVYLADAVGNQSQTLYIRSLALDYTFDARRYIIREIGISLSIATILSLLVGTLSYLIWKDMSFMLIFGISIFVTVVVAIIAAIAIPTICKKLKLDPAIASGPFATILRDLSSILIYFVVSSYILYGTLR